MLDAAGSPRGNRARQPDLSPASAWKTRSAGIFQSDHLQDSVREKVENRIFCEEARQSLEMEWRTRRMEFINLEEARSRPHEVTALRLLGLQEWPADLGSFPALRRLNVSRNRMAPQLGGLSAIESLDLTDMGLEEVPSDLFHLANLRELDLRFNPGSRIRLGAFSALGNLRVLKLPYAAQGDELPVLPELEELDLSGVSLGRLGAEIGKMPKLRKLNLNLCDLRDLPPELWELGQLEELQLEGADVPELPPALGNLRHLKVLNLHGVPLTRLPAEILQLQQLEVLHLKSESLTDLPPLPPSLRVLRVLRASLAGCPAVLANLPNLEELDLSDCNLASLPNADWSRLRRLNLDRCQLSSLPEGLGQWRQLEYLKLQGNPLERLPEGFAQLVQLEVLDLSGGKLTSLPPVAAMSRLRCLYLDDNPVEDLPALPETLEVLSLRRTRIEKFPDSLHPLQALTALQLTGLEFSPAEMGKLESYQKTLKRSCSLDKPRLKQAVRKPKASAAGLSPAVCKQIARLGGSLQEQPPQSLRVTIGGTDYELPEALRQWRDDVRFPNQTYAGPLGGLDLRGIRLGYQSFGESYEAFRNAPYFEIGVTGHFSLLLVQLGSRAPSDPPLFYLDHDDFWQTTASPYKVKLSEFLSGLSPEG